MKIDVSIHSFFNTYIEALNGFESKILKNISSLESNLPLSSSVSSTNSELEKFMSNNNVKRIDEQLFNELKSLYSLNSNFNANNNRVDKVTDTMPVREAASLTNELSTVLFKFANDIRFLSSGPRSGFGEMTIPENEPGSSIMPGKVNPTQCESLTMICSQVLGNANAIMIASSVSTFEGNSFLPLVSNNIVRSLVLLTDGIRSFRTKCMEGADFIKEKLNEEIKGFRI
jgi:fumarate hydratase class II